jgi:hypothetical protein
VQTVGSEVSEEPDPYQDGPRVRPGRFVPKTGESAAEPEAKDDEGSSLGMTLAASVASSARCSLHAIVERRNMEVPQRYPTNVVE